MGAGQTAPPVGAAEVGAVAGAPASRSAGGSTAVNLRGKLGTSNPPEKESALAVYLSATIARRHRPASDPGKADVERCRARGAWPRLCGAGSGGRFPPSGFLAEPRGDAPPSSCSPPRHKTQLPGTCAEPPTSLCVRAISL